MTYNAIVSICSPREVTGPEPDAIGGLTQDSRAVEQGSVFIAVKGTRVDGHAFIDDAIRAGASVIITEEPIDTQAEVCVLTVADTRSLIGPLAQAFEGNPAKELTLIGITGTNGKTTVATLTYQALQAMGVQVSLLGTVAKRINKEVLDSALTTADPIELARDMRRMVDAGSTHLVMEVSSHALDQHRVGGIRFAVAAFTNLSHDHLDYHKSMEAYAKAKKQLFDGLPTHATAIINGDDPWHDVIARDCKGTVITFGFESDQPVQCHIRTSDVRGVHLTVDEIEIETPLVGAFNAYNVAQTFLICQSLGFEDQQTARAVGGANGPVGRLQRVPQGDGADQPLVLVDYAHTPGALENVLQSLAGMKEEQQKLHVIFGCGGDRDTTKRPKMARVAEAFADLVTITTDNPRSEDPDAIIDDAMKGFRTPANVHRITDRREAITQTIAKADACTIILIAGKGHETYQEVNGLRHPFDDHAIASEALGHRNHNSNIPEVH